MKLLMATLSTLFALSFSAPVKFSAEDCGASAGHYQSFDVVPSKPHTGQVFKVTNHFSFDEDISGGQFDVKVAALGGIPLKHQTGPLCGSDTSYDVHLAFVKVATVTVYGSECPIAKGPADIKYDIKLAAILPPALGDASFHLTAKDQKGTDILCVKAHLAIQLEGDEAPDTMLQPEVANSTVGLPWPLSKKCHTNWQCIMGWCILGHCKKIRRLSNSNGIDGMMLV